MHKSVENFIKQSLLYDDIFDKTILEVGSRNINGSCREYINSLNPKSYLGIDIENGEGVDIVMKAEELVKYFGKEQFDIIISTETLEHCKNWKSVISNMKQILKPKGLLVITTRSRGFPKHEYPGDYWRFEVEDFKQIFEDFEILDLMKDPQIYGVFIKIKKPKNFKEKSLKEMEVYHI
jgi:SAM-dependent methyltransferase